MFYAPTAHLVVYWNQLNIHSRRSLCVYDNYSVPF